MLHTMIYFLAHGEDLSDAEGRVAEYLETGHFFHYYDIRSDSSGPLTKKREDLMDFIKDWDWNKAADKLFEQAAKHKEAGNISLFGSYLFNAGVRYAQCLTVDTYVYNIDSEDYSIPDDDSGWWVIAVDFYLERHIPNWRIADNTLAFDYNRLFEIWADFDDMEASEEAKKLIEKYQLGEIDSISLTAFCYGYEKAIALSGSHR